MKKRILCAIMSAVMVVGMMTGCGSKETSSNKTVENVSDKTEEKYAERMEAYLDYFQNEEKDYDGVVGAAITLDSDSLPLLWLAYSDSEEFEDVRFQLCSYEKNKVEVLAEKKVDDVGGMFPYNDTGIIGMRLEIGDNEDSSTVALVYLQDEQDFEVFEADYFDYDEKVDIEEYCKKMQDDIDIYRIINGQCNFLTLNYADKTAYLGISDRNQIYYDMLDNIGALDYSTSSSEADMMQQARKLSDKYKDNKFVSEIFNEHFELERDDRYFVKSTLCLPDGTELDENDIDEYLGISKKEIEDDGVSIDQTGNYFRFCVDKDAELLMRNLKKNPAYTPFDLLLVFAKMIEDIYNGMYSDSQFGDIVDVKELLKDAADNKDNSVDSTESIRREDSTESIHPENSTEMSEVTNSSDTFDVSAYGIDIIKFEMNNNVLDVETEDGDKWIYPIADKCIWCDAYYGDDGLQIGDFSEYADFKLNIDMEREAYLKYGDYDSPPKYNITVENGQVISVYRIMP